MTISQYQAMMVPYEIEYESWHIRDGGSAAPGFISCFGERDWWSIISAREDLPGRGAIQGATTTGLAC